MAAVINFTRGVPATESFPTDELIEASRLALERHGAVILQYGKSTGFAPLREWLADWRGVTVEQTLITNGSLQLIEFLGFHFIQPGDVVFTESPTYDRTIGLLQRHQAKIVGIPLEADGPNLAALEQALTQDTPKFFYVIPDFQNPAGATCSLAKRRRLVELAEKYNFWLLEDSPYRHLRYRGAEQPTLFEMCPQRVLYMASFTKLIAAGLRVGFIFGDVNIINSLAKIAEDTYITGSLFTQGVVAEYCRAGHVPGQIEKLKALYAPRLEACLDALQTHLPDAEATRPDGGFFMSITLPEGVTTRQVLQQAKTYDLNLTDGQAFFPNGGGERFLRLPYCALTPAEINEGVRRLALAIKDLQNR